MKADVQALIQKFISFRGPRDLILHDQTYRNSHSLLLSEVQYARGACLALAEAGVITPEQQDEINAYFEEIYEQAVKSLREAA